MPPPDPWPPQGPPNPQTPPPGGWGPPPGYGYQPQPNEPSAVTAMVLGILGVAVCSLAAPFAWSMGKKSLANIQAYPGRYAGEGMAKAGHIMGIIGTVLLIVSVVFLVIYFAFIGAMMGELADRN